jgi:membrane-associated phospholipid phosphatase
MDSTPRQVLPDVAGPTRRGAHQVRPSGRRRRPSGEAPPLPHHLQTSGVGWLVALVVLVVLSIMVFGGGLRGPAVAVTVLDDAMVRWLAGLDAPGLEGIWRALAFLASWWVINTVGFGLVLALLALRRFRHLILAVIVAQLLTMISGNVLGSNAHRPRPFGVVIGTSWGGWALPSPVMELAATLVVVLYTLVPQGRWRQRGKWVAAGVVTLVGLGRVALGAEAPTDVLVGAAIGVAIPLALFRRFAPNEVFPISYRRGRAAHLDVTGARGAAIRRGLEDQLGLAVTEVKPFGLSGSAGSTPLRITVKGSRPDSCSASCMPAATCVPTAGTSSAASCCTAAWRTRSRSTPSAGWSSRRTTPCGCAATPACPAPDPTAWSSSPPNGSTCWSPSSSPAPSSSARPR